MNRYPLSCGHSPNEGGRHSCWATWLGSRPGCPSFGSGSHPCDSRVSKGDRLKPVEAVQPSMAAVVAVALQSADFLTHHRVHADKCVTGVCRATAAEELVCVLDFGLSWGGAQRREQVVPSRWVFWGCGVHVSNASELGNVVVVGR